MRLIGTLPEEARARAFSDALYVRGIENTVEADDDGQFSIWVHDEAQKPEALRLLVHFREEPSSEDWIGVHDQAAKRRREEEREMAKRTSRVITREALDYQRSTQPNAWLPMLLIVLCVAATLWAGSFSLMGETWRPPKNAAEEMDQAAERARKQQRENQLAITKWRTPQTEQEQIALHATLMQHGHDSAKVRRHFYDATLPEVRSGEVWRLITPIFVHYSLLHLIFNLLWLRDLGGFIQIRLGTRVLVALVLSSGLVSNLAQLGWSGPLFGGMSGVNYALFGYLWMRGKFDRSQLWQMNPQIVQMMMVWFFLCFTPLIPNVANAAHTAGLLFGMLTGFAVAKLRLR